MTRTARIAGMGFIVALVIVTGPQPRAASIPAPGEGSPLPDCGTTALYAFLHVNGRPVSMARIEAALPSLPAAGYSLKDLRDGASKLGLRTIGRMERSGGKAPQGPRLAFIQRAGHGHFIVVRPVGHTGNLVQIIEASREPVIMDSSSLYGSPGWTGKVLAPAGRASRPAMACVIAALSLVLFRLLRHLSKRRRNGVGTTAAG